jgi:hypothetical protein
MWPWLRQSRTLNRTVENTVMNGEFCRITARQYAMLRQVPAWFRAPKGRLSHASRAGGLEMLTFL